MRMRTFDGRMVDAFNIKPEDVIPEILMRSLCQLNRFTGHCLYPYSVGQHTLNLVETAPDRLKRAALIHDWQEAWFNDMNSPMKKELPEYKLAEKQAGLVVAFVMKISERELEIFDPLDKSIYINERNILQPQHAEIGMGDERSALIMTGDYSFDEMHWNDVYQRLLVWYYKIFEDDWQ